MWWRSICCSVASRRRCLSSLARRRQPRWSGGAKLSRRGRPRRCFSQVFGGKGGKPKIRPGNRDFSADERESAAEKCESVASKCEPERDQRESGADQRESGADQRESGADQRES